MPIQFLESVSRHGPRSLPVWIGGELWIACEGTGVSTGGRAHSSLFFCSADQAVHDVYTGFVPAP